ncbi:MAG: MMPL family transporter, partial [Burkholderiales bacterium]
VTPDSRSRLVIARPAAPPFDTEFSRALLQDVESGRAAAAKARAEAAIEEPPPPLHVEIAGGHRIAVETEGVVRRESILNTAGSLALILPLLFIVFRSLWLVAVGPLPSALALVVVLGALGLAGATLSAAATASAAMLFGLGVDGVVLLYVTHTLARSHGADDAGESLAGAASSMLLGMWTTAATFYGLIFVDFPSLQQLGALIGHSMVLCGIFTLLLVPALLPTRAPRRPARHLTMPRLAGWVDRRRTAILVAACFATLALGAAAFTIRIDPTLDRLRSVTPGARVLDEIGRRFELPHDVYAIVQRGPALEPLLGVDERIRADVLRLQPSLGMMPASSLLPSALTQRARTRKLEAAGLSPAGVHAELGRAAEAAGFTRESMRPFLERLPRLLASAQALTFESYVDHGLADLIGRFVAKTSDGWLLATYAFPATDEQVAALGRIVSTAGGSATLTGLPLVNRELADRFVPQFLKGLAIGTVLVIALILMALRNWRLSAMALAPAALGLVWAAGILAIAGIELDLFAVFAVVTFVGIGVDYGIHLVHRYRERGHASRAVEELAPVILVAAAITLLGYGTLVASSYPPLRSIGVVSVVTVLTLAAASLLVLPALLPRTPAAASRAPLGSQPGAAS